MDWPFDIKQADGKAVLFNPADREYAGRRAAASTAVARAVVGAWWDGTVHFAPLIYLACGGEGEGECFCCG